MLADEVTAMSSNKFSENPYQSPPIRAELADESPPRKPNRDSLGYILRHAAIWIVGAYAGAMFLQMILVATTGIARVGQFELILILGIPVIYWLRRLIIYFDYGPPPKSPKGP